MGGFALCAVVLNRARNVGVLEDIEHAIIRENVEAGEFSVGRDGEEQVGRPLAAHQYAVRVAGLATDRPMGKVLPTIRSMVRLSRCFAQPFLFRYELVSNGS
jgi:hypothetical protein